MTRTNHRAVLCICFSSLLTSAQATGARRAGDKTTLDSTIVPIPRDTKVQVMAMETISSANVTKGSRVQFAVIKDVVVGGTTVIPEGTPVIGVVTKVERGVPFRHWAELRIHVKEVNIAHDTSLPLNHWPYSVRRNEPGDVATCVVFFVVCIALGNLGDDGWGEDGAPKPDADSGQQAVLRPCVAFDFWTTETQTVARKELAASAAPSEPPKVVCPSIREMSQIREDPELDRLLFR
jgi:hypothetical protein